MADRMADKEPHWYVAHTYSGYEKKVKMDIEKTIENRNLQDQILEVSIPMLNVTEGEDEDSKVVPKKMFPAYVLINMYLNDDTWYVVRNTRGVTGFVGPGSKPVPLTDAEMASMGLKANAPACEFSIGDSVVVKSGVWEIQQELFARSITKTVWSRSTSICLDVRRRLRLVSTMWKSSEKAA